MIDFGKILKRAWQILWNYRVLWIFGFLLAITAGGGTHPQASYQFNKTDVQTTQQNISPEFQQFVNQAIQWFDTTIVPWFTPQRVVTTIVLLILGIVLFGFLVSSLVALVRYPSEIAVIRMVDDYEQTGQKVGFKQGWKMGWSRAAFNLWVIDLVIFLPVFLFVLVVCGLGLAVYYSTQASQTVAVTGVVVSISCFSIFLLAFALAMVFLSLLRQFFARAAALENTSVRDSFRRGWEVFKSNWKSGILMWLIMLGLNIGYAIASVLIFFLLLLPMVFTVLAGLIVAGLPSALIGWLVSLFSPVWVGALVGAVIFLPFFFLIAFSPVALVAGWAKIFESSAWTLTYREMKALGSLLPEKELPPLVPEQTA